MSVAACTLCMGTTDVVGELNAHGECESCAACYDCGEDRDGHQSDDGGPVRRRCERCHEDHARVVAREKREAMLEARGDYLRDEGKDRKPW